MRLIEGGWLLAALLAASGCESLNPRTVQIDAASGRFQSAQLTYQLDSVRLGQPAQTARVEARQVSYQQPPRTPLTDASHARLSIQYPHPRGRAGYALAEVILESERRPEKAGSNAAKSGFQKFVAGLTDAMNDILPGMVYGNGVQEAWALDVPKEDLDQLLGHLANSGYFQYGPPPSSGVEMFTRLDGKIIRKNWRQVPALDAFIERVRQEGKLVSYESPRSSKTALAKDAAGADSMAAYGPPPQSQPAPMSPPPQPFPVGNMQPPGPFGTPPQPGPGSTYSSMPPAQNAWPQPTMPQQTPQPWAPLQNVPAGAYGNLPPQQSLPQPPSAPAAAAYGSPPQQYGAPAPPQPYPQGSPVGPTAGGGAYPYLR
ncbi:MAG TPA: hypothetical protein VHB99_06215 [Pirellulales bacterium]|nr:hypothetical protein [Pirellulales bacterium]